MALGKKIVEIRKAKGLTQSQFIQLLKYELPENEHDKLQGAISNLERRDSNSSKYISQIAKVFGLTIDDLVNAEPYDVIATIDGQKFGIELKSKQSDDYLDTPMFSRSNTSSVKQEIPSFLRTSKPQKNECPVISWVMAGSLCSPDNVYGFEDAEEWRYCPVKHSEKTYVLKIASTSMQPEYMEGSEIFVDPTIEPLHNDDVVVSDEEGRATFKRLKITPEGKYLEALNPDFPQRIIKVPEGTIICGVVIYSGRKTR